MADAISDYRQSIALFEKLLNETPGDRKVRHFLADSLGLFGMGCCFRFTNRDKEAEAFYRRAIELRRDLVRSIDSGTLVETGADEIELHNLQFLVYTVQIVAEMVEQRGDADEGENLRRQVEQDIAALAERWSGPEFQVRRQIWSRKLSEAMSFSFDRTGRRNAILGHRLAIILDPDNARAHNDLAWRLVIVPDDPWYNPALGLEHARKAVALDPSNAHLWNTVGVAAFRAVTGKRPSNCSRNRSVSPVAPPTISSSWR